MSPNDKAQDDQAQAAQKEQKIDLLEHKTTGEKWFSRLRFGVAETTILAFGAVLAYVARYGSESKWNAPKHMQRWFEKGLDKILEKPLASDNEKIKSTAAMIAGAGASTMVTFHGGNAFIPIMKHLENKRPDIVDHFNKKYGKPGEYEAGQERLKHEEKETWGDVIKGRLASFGIIATSFVTADALAGIDTKSNPHIRRFEKYEMESGKLVAKLFSKKGKELIKDMPQGGKPLYDALEANSKSFRFGRVLALDIYATTAAILVWTAVSKLSAIQRHKKELYEEEKKSPHRSVDTTVIDDAKASQPDQQRSAFAARTNGPAIDHRARAVKEPPSTGVALS